MIFLFKFYLQSHHHCMTTIIIMRSVWGVIHAVVIYLVRITSEPDALKIKFCAICILQMLRSWSVQILCNNYAVLSHNHWDVPLLVEKVQPHWYFRYHHRLVRVSNHLPNVEEREEVKKQFYTSNLKFSLLLLINNTIHFILSASTANPLWSFRL